MIRAFAPRWQPVTPVNFMRVLFSAARFQQLRWASNLILLIRRPLTPVLAFITTLLAFRISGQTSVPEDQVVGFLIIGALAMQAWTASIWASGFGLENDAYEGTLPSILASTASRIALVAGYGMGDLLLSVPSVLLIMVVGWFFGATYGISSVTLVAFGIVTIFIATLIIGIALAGVFILSRNGNALANFLQTPIHIIAGFYFPRSVLPDWASLLGAIFPITHAVHLTREAALNHATWSSASGDILKFALSGVLILLFGIWALGRVDHELRRSGSLNLF